MFKPFALAGAVGFEPTARGFGDPLLYQLSYTPTFSTRFILPFPLQKVNRNLKKYKKRNNPTVFSNNFSEPIDTTKKTRYNIRCIKLEFITPVLWRRRGGKIDGRNQNQGQ